MRVFLGGTCNESEWRNRMMTYLNDVGVDYFNPVVDDRDSAAQANELKEREACDICLYVITPKMTGTYSIAEVVDDSNKRPEKTVFIILKSDGVATFDNYQIKSLEQVAALVKCNGARVFKDLKTAADMIGGRDRRATARSSIGGVPMGLREKQSKFLLMISELIQYADSLGYQLTVGDAYRDPRAFGKQGSESVYGRRVSCHKLRLAMDFNLFKDGEYLTASSDHLPLGLFWEAMGGTWGGRLKHPDGNHYSLEHLGVK